MTTIAYKDGVMACDSQADWYYKEDGFKKIYKKGEILIGFAGSYGQGILFCDWILGKGEKPGNTDDLFAIVVKNGKCYQYDRTLVPLPCEPYVAIGSGSKFAIAAMDCGKGAKKAIEVAKRRDVDTGGKVHAFKIPIKK